MLTVYDDDDNIFRSICAGAVGYLLKRTSREILQNAIREAHTGGVPMNAGIARRVLDLFRQTNAPASPGNDPPLTPRELDILQALVDGGSYKMIADREFISIETVRNHIKSIYTKLHVHSKSEAVAKALQVSPHVLLRFDSLLA
jgi:DNA-binding NarL/FixJ family response regulator